MSTYNVGDRVMVSGGISSHLWHDGAGEGAIGIVPETTADVRLIHKYELSEPTLCIVLGRTIRKTGVLRKGVTGHSWDDAGEYDSYNWLDVTDTIKCWMVMPIDGNRYRKPFAALAEQMQPVAA